MRNSLTSESGHQSTSRLDELIAGSAPLIGVNLHTNLTLSERPAGPQLRRVGNRAGAGEAAFSTIQCGPSQRGVYSAIETPLRGLLRMRLLLNTVDARVGSSVSPGATGEALFGFTSCANFRPLPFACIGAHSPPDGGRTCRATPASTTPSSAACRARTTWAPNRTPGTWTRIRRWAEPSPRPTTCTGFSERSGQPDDELATGRKCAARQHHHPDRQPDLQHVERLGGAEQRPRVRAGRRAQLADHAAGEPPGPSASRSTRCISSSTTPARRSWSPPSAPITNGKPDDTAGGALRPARRPAAGLPRAGRAPVRRLVPDRRRQSPPRATAIHDPGATSAGLLVIRRTCC